MTACCMVLAANTFAQENGKRLENHLIAPKGGWQCGMSVMYTDFSSNNSEFMLMLKGLGTSASMTRIAPEALFAYMDNHAVGVRFQYTDISGMVDSMTADLLGNLTMSFDNINALSSSMGGSLFHRTYVGLDSKGRIGLFWDYSLGYTKSTTQFYMGDTSDAYSINNKFNISFAPGFVYFPMNNVSVQASVSMGGLSYNDITAFELNEVTGTRRAWKAYAGISLLDLNFGLTVHL